MRYDYREEIKADVISYLQENKLALDKSNVDKLYDTLFVEDSVTGNGSGSYTFNYTEARNHVLANMGELQEACEEFEIDDAELGKRFVNEDWEWMDVTIRCYLLSSVLCDMID